MTVLAPPRPSSTLVIGDAMLKNQLRSILKSDDVLAETQPAYQRLILMRARMEEILSGGEDV